MSVQAPSYLLVEVLLGKLPVADMHWQGVGVVEVGVWAGRVMHREAKVGHMWQ